MSNGLRNGNVKYKLDADNTKYNNLHNKLEKIIDIVDNNRGFHVLRYISSIAPAGSPQGLRSVFPMEEGTV